MARSSKPKLGDVFSFSPDGRGPVVTCVLFVSKVYRDVVLLGVIKMGDSVEEVDLAQQMNQSDAYRFYTIGSEVKKYWNRIGSIEIPDDLIDKYSYRRVGGTVVQRDTEIRSATRDEILKGLIPQMGVQGIDLVEKRLSERFLG